MSKPLFDDDDDDGDGGQINSDERIQINQSFATAYTSRKQKEEFRRYEHEDDDDDSSSDDESEDENAELLTTSLDVSILQTIQALRRKDDSIYDPTKKFFPSPLDDDDNDDNEDETEKKQTKKRFKDVIREQILEQMDHEENGTIPDDETKHRLEYDKEQSELKNAFLESTKEDDDEQEEDWMVVKSRSKPSSDETEEVLQKEYEELEKTKPAVSNITDPHGEIQDGDKFLLDFLKNKKWIDKDDDNNNNNDSNVQVAATSDDDESLEQLEKTDDFESAYNFRFEQAEATATSGADYSVVPYARAGSMETLRRKDDTRKLKRDTRKEKKAAERKAKEEQLKRLKNAKREEMEERLKEIKKVMGTSNLDEEAMLKLMEGDFDPDKFEQIMQEQYGDEFYHEDDPQWKSDADVRQALLQEEDGKALVGLDDDPEGGMYDEVADYDGDENYDAEDDDGYVEEDEHPEEETTMEKKLKEKMEEELYKLDYEDIVAGMPTRFKYRKVEPNDYGLTTQEILFARDSTLKNFVSLKKMAPYKEDGEHHVGSKKRRKFREMLKADLEEAMAEEGYKEQEEKVEEEIPMEEPVADKKKRRQKKGKKKGKQDELVVVENHTSPFSGEHPEPPTIEEPIEKLEDKSRTTREKKGKKGDAPDVVVAQPTMEVDVESSQPEVDNKASNKKKEKKRKQRETNGGETTRSKKKKKFKVEGISESRLGAFGL